MPAATASDGPRRACRRRLFARPARVYTLARGSLRHAGHACRRRRAGAGGRRRGHGPEHRARSSTSSRSTSWAMPRAGRAAEPPTLSLFPGAEGDGEGRLPAAARRVHAGRHRPVRAPGPIARGPRGLGGRGGIGRGRRVQRAVRRARPAHVPRLALGQPRPRRRQPRQRARQRRARGDRRGPPAQVRHQPAGGRRRARHGGLREGAGQPGAPVLARPAEDAAVPAVRHARRAGRRSRSTARCSRSRSCRRGS